jgi:hypothetical protein
MCLVVGVMLARSRSLDEGQEATKNPDGSSCRSALAGIIIPFQGLPKVRKHQPASLVTYLL